MVTNMSKTLHLSKTELIKNAVYEYQSLMLRNNSATENKNQDLVNFISNLKPIESFESINDSVEYVNNLRKSRTIESIY
jgi:hypothetical protein